MKRQLQSAQRLHIPSGSYRQVPDSMISPSWLWRRTISTNAREARLLVPESQGNPVVAPMSSAMSKYDLRPPTEEQRTRITSRLSEEERHVLLEHGTEAAFCGVFLDNHKDGIYTCRFCGLPLFRSSAKFDSGTGWPSFFRPYDESHIRRVRDTSYGMMRIEEVCARCGSHLGHVFPDGPPPTGERHCLNSVSLSFTEQGQPLPDRLERGPPEGVADKD